MENFARQKKLGSAPLQLKQSSVFRPYLAVRVKYTVDTSAIIGLDDGGDPNQGGDHREIERSRVVPPLIIFPLLYFQRFPTL